MDKYETRLNNLSDKEDILFLYSKLFWIQNNYTKEINENIFGIDLSDHMWNKWIECEMNLLFFINRLDSVNNDKILEYISRI